MRTVVVTGSREWPESNSGPIANALRGAEALIVGDAKGADDIALRIALEWDVICSVFCASRLRAKEIEALSSRLGKPIGVELVANWDEYGGGLSAGPKRNGAMVTEAVIRRDVYEMDIVAHAFPLPGSAGTWDCVKQLRKAGFVVKVFGDRRGENLSLF